MSLLADLSMRESDMVADVGQRSIYLYCAIRAAMTRHRNAPS